MWGKILFQIKYVNIYSINLFLLILFAPVNILRLTIKVCALKKLNVDLDAKRPLFLLNFTANLSVSTNFSENLSYTFHENIFSCSRLTHNITDGRTDTAKLMCLSLHLPLQKFKKIPSLSFSYSSLPFSPPFILTFSSK